MNTQQDIFWPGSRLRRKPVATQMRSDTIASHIKINHILYLRPLLLSCDRVCVNSCCDANAIGHKHNWPANENLYTHL